MSIKQSVLVESIPIEPVSGLGTYTSTHIDVKVYYDKGGLNYWTYKNEPRGYWLTIQPVEHGKYGTGFCITGQARDGIRIFLKEVARFSAKTLNELAHDPRIPDEVAIFMDKHGYVRKTDMVPQATSADTSRR